MLIEGNKREQKTWDNTKKIGFFEASVKAINPSIEELLELGIETKEGSTIADYTGEKDDVKTLRLCFWLTNVKTGELFPTPLTLFLEDRKKVNKDGTKTQFIDSVGNCSWSDEKEHLPEWFLKREVREAMIGEEDLYKFVQKWLGNLVIRGKGSENSKLQLDWNKLIGGNVSELRAILKETGEGDYKTNIVVQAIVKLKTNDEGKENAYQGVYSKEFLPGYAMKVIRNTVFSEENIALWKHRKATKVDGKTVYLKPEQEFAVNATDSQYGITDIYYLGELKDYNPKEHFAASEKVLDNTDASY